MDVNYLVRKDDKYMIERSKIQTTVGNLVIVILWSARRYRFLLIESARINILMT